MYPFSNQHYTVSKEPCQVKNIEKTQIVLIKNHSRIHLKIKRKRIHYGRKIGEC